MAERQTRTTGRPRTSGRSVGQSQSLTRGLNILEALAGAGHGLSLSDVSQMAGLAPSTTHRLLRTLEQLQFVQQDEELGLWHIGVKAFIIGNGFVSARDFVAESRPYLHRLMEETGETANLGVQDDGYAVFLAQVESQEMMRMIVKLGSRAPLHASGVGKALLASMEEAEIERILQRRGLPKVTPNTLDTPAKLRADLTEIRERGYACDYEEHAIGLRCVASTIHDETGKALAAISVSGPKARITDSLMHELGAAVSRTAREITARLGGEVPRIEAVGR